MTRTLIDITLPLAPVLPSWPGEPRPETRLLSDMAAGKSCNVTHLSMAVHYGTHVDAPCHFVPGGIAVEALELDVLVGPALVVDVGDADRVDVAQMEAIDWSRQPCRLLFKSRNSRLWDNPDQPFDPEFVALTPEAAQLAVARGVRLIGVDYLSVERFGEPGHRTHHILLQAGVVPLEGLDLRRAEAGWYQLVALPLKLAGADGAPTRAILIADAPVA